MAPSKRRWILNGRFLEEKVSGTNFDGSPGFEAVGLLGYDNAQQRYPSAWASTMGTGTCNGVGESDSSGKRFVFTTEAHCPVQKRVVRGREEIRIETSDCVVAESYILVNGEEMKMMEMVAVRKE
jgi:hypothetical protein